MLDTKGRGRTSGAENAQGVLLAAMVYFGIVAVDWVWSELVGPGCKALAIVLVAGSRNFFGFSPKSPPSSTRPTSSSH